MIIREIQCFECSYCNKKYDTEAKCLSCERLHENNFSAELGRFDTYKTELTNFYNKKNVRPTVSITEQVTTIEQVPTGELDSSGNPITTPTEVTRNVTRETTGAVPEIYCAKCLKPILENALYMKAYNNILCLECVLPILQLFSKNYLTFKTQFGNTINIKNINNSGNIVISADQILIKPTERELESESNCCCEHHIH